MKNMLIKAFEYKTWADIRTLDAIEEIDNKRFGDAYGFALQQLNHMAIVEELFRSRLENTPPTHTSTNTDTVPGFNVLKQGLKDSNVWYLGYALSEYLPTQPVTFVFADGKNGMMTVEEILFHIINHGTYHRGNIARALDLADVPHPVDGYGLFIHEQQPERRKGEST